MSAELRPRLASSPGDGAPRRAEDGPLSADRFALSPLVADLRTRALEVAGELGWEVYFKDQSAGIIEAVDTTAIMAFWDDVVIRVLGDAQGTKLDLRSVSRVGVGDLGANAARIRAFQQAFLEG